MPKASNLGYIGIGSQGAAVTTAATPTWFVPYVGADGIAPEFDVEVLHEGGDGKYDVNSVKTQHREAVQFSCYARPKIAGNLYAALLGKDAPTHITTTPFYHTITVKTTDLLTTPMQPWLTVEKMLVGTTNSRVHRIRGVKLSEISLEAEAGMPVMMNVVGTGLTAAVRTTANTPTYETGNPFSFYNGVFTVNTPTTTNFNIRSFSVTLRAENDDANQTTELTRKDIINLRFVSEVTLGLNYEDYTMWAKANYGAGTAPTSSFSDGSVSILLKTGSAATERRLQLNIPKLRFEPHALPLDSEAKRVEQPLSGIALKQATTNLVTVTCYNTIATTLPL